MSYIHYKLSMLGLILTATSLPPPVWTHNYCLFKLVLRHLLCDVKSNLLFPLISPEQWWLHFSLTT